MDTRVREGDRIVTCKLHGETMPAISKSEAEARGITPGDSGCRACTAELLSKPDVTTMTGDERADELADWMDRDLTVDMGLLFSRCEALVGRGIWTHEYAEPRLLIEEARSHEHPKNLEAHIIGLAHDIMGADKPVIPVRLESPND
jgi:hypothetical protein